MPTVTEIEAGLKSDRKDSDLLDVSTNAEIVEVVEDESGNHLLAPILGIVIVIVLLLLLVSGVMLYKKHVKSRSREQKFPVEMSNSSPSSKYPEEETMLTSEKESSV